MDLTPAYSNFSFSCYAREFSGELGHAIGTRRLNFRHAQKVHFQTAVRQFLAQISEEIRIKETLSP